MLTRLNMLKLALLTMIVAIAATTTASAAEYRCLRAGERIIESRPGMVYVAKPMTPVAEWDAGAKNVYACSTTFRKRVSVGGIGKSGGLPYTVGHMSGTEKYAAFVSNDNDVRVFDLASGLLVAYHAPLSNLPRSQSSVTSLVLRESGQVGWIAVGKSPEGSPALEVREARPDGPARVVANDLKIDPYLLLLEESGRIRWSPSADFVPVQSRKPKSVPTRKSGTCVRKDESVFYVSSGVVVTKKSFRQKKWQDGYRLTACSTRFHRRVVLGKFGVWNGYSQTHIFGAVGMQANVRYIAFAREDYDPEFVSNFELKAFDLATGELILGVPDGSPTLRLDSNGNVAWIAEYGPPKGGGWFGLNLFDARGVTKITNSGYGGSPLDSRFVAFEEAADGVKLHYADTTDYDPPIQLRQSLGHH
jgi:hypothetical protein